MRITGRPAEGVLYWLMLIFLLVRPLSSPSADIPPQPEYSVKAAYVSRFGLFVHWPPQERRNSFVIGVLGTNPFDGSLQELVKGQTLRGRPIQVRQYASIDSLEAQILYISASEAGRMKSLLASLQGKPILTVSDVKGFAEAGGSIEFVTVGNKLRFNVNLDSLRSSGLNASSELLQVAEKVLQTEERP